MLRFILLGNGQRHPGYDFLPDQKGEINQAAKAERGKRAVPLCRRAASRSSLPCPLNESRRSFTHSLRCTCMSMLNRQLSRRRTHSRLLTSRTDDIKLTCPQLGSHFQTHVIGTADLSIQLLFNLQLLLLRFRVWRFNEGPSENK